DPFLLSKPEEVRIQGRDLKVYEGDEKTPRILNGNYRLNLSLNELYVPLPALIKSKKTESVISKSHIRRSDGITKIPDAVLFNSDSEIYVENAGTVNIRKGVPDVLEVFRYLPLITAVGFGIGFGAGIGIGALMRNISLNTIVFAGAVGGAVYSSFWIPFLHLGEKIKNLEKRVFGDGDMSFWMKGEELY
ncbi:MAG: hypothetical protein GTN37_00505, partial [Candidatus Aenigmarchaeota archaeon]|nr:hypothetical protein [Candidatus Aenigmarchaeota archaeon]NIS72892.1 hypothetical protein [Candidatus Aenigmarchaeota archaeon]